jgi:hypothetical protein
VLSLASFVHRCHSFHLLIGPARGSFPGSRGPLELHGPIRLPRFSCIG